jgi:hypothetical protein
MPLGPKRAPGRYEVPVSKGAPATLSISEILLAIRYRTNECNVEVRVGGQARTVRQTTERGDTRENGIRLVNV